MKTGIMTLVLAAWGLALPSVAEDIRPGCYERVYTQDHLDKHPQQVVWQIRLNDQQGRVLSQTLYCGTETRSDLCRAECDAGSLEVRTQKPDSLTFRTRYLLVGSDGCEGSLDLAEVQDQWVSYRLNRVDASICGGM